MCNCYNEVEKKYKERTGDEKAKIDGALIFGSGCFYPTLTGLYHKKKKDGTLSNRVSEEHILPTYCPFCGKRYEE